MSDSDSEFEFTPPHIAKNIVLNLLPEKSKEKYNKQYKIFCDWCETKKIAKFTENVLLVYFMEKSKTIKSSTLWSIYSMLKATIMVNKDIDISHFKKLIAFMKKNSVGYRAKKSKIFSRIQINEFLSEAPDERYLMMKVCKIKISII